MKTRKARKSFWFLLASEITVAAHLLLFLPPKAQAATPVPAESETKSGEAALAMLAVERSEPAPQEPVVVNKAVPDVEPPPQYPTFSPVPTDEELFRARVFGEPLIPEAGETNDAENQALAQAITTYLHGGNSEALEPLEGVVTSFPSSRWRVAVQANVGSWYRQKGYFTRAQRNLTEAWRLGRNSPTVGVRRLAEFAAGELMQIHMQFGQVDPLEALVAEFEGRELSGGITEKLYAAKATVWGLRNDHQKAIPSGSVALERLRLDQHEKAERQKRDQDPSYRKKAFARHQELDRFPAKHEGASLAEIQDLADLTDLELQMARRENPAAEIPVPSVVHFKQGHFAALVEKRGERFRFDDPLLGGEVWMSRQAFEEEISGFFLVEQGRLLSGWRRANRSEVGNIRGKCVYAIPDFWRTQIWDILWGGGPAPPTCVDPGTSGPGSSPGSGPTGPGPGDEPPPPLIPPKYVPPGPKTPVIPVVEPPPLPPLPPPPPPIVEPPPPPPEPGGGPGTEGGGGGGGCGLAAYRFHGMLASVQIYDVPVGYAPPRTPSIFFAPTYNQREATQPQTFSYSNLGPRWTFNWLSFVQDDPSAVGNPVELYLRGGGRESYDGFVSGVSAYETDSKARIRIVSSSPIVYEKVQPDGSIEVFSQSDGAASAPRRVFLTAWKDSAGNTVTFTYDAQLRLVSVTDAIGQVTTLSYELAGDPLKITKVTDPFGRFATFAYDELGRLVKITDVIGLTSEFEYGSSDFIRALTTAYGTTTFRNGTHLYGVPANQWVQATDPLGGTERVEFLLTNAPVSATDAANTVPTGFTGNSNLNTHMSVYYSKLAMERATTDPPDPTKGVITRWRSSTQFKVSGSQVQSIKPPLGNRVWFEHAGETIANGVGPDGRPSKIGRVLDDGTSEVHRYEYNVAGALTRYTDPAGRESVYVFGTGSTPDVDPSAGAGLDLLQVKHRNGSALETLAQFTYSSQRNVLTHSDALGNTWSYTYNSQGQLLSAQSPPTTSTPDGLTMTLAYDTEGYVTAATGVVPGSTTTFTYDDYGRLETISPPVVDSVTLDYDDMNRVTRITFEDGTYQEIVYNRLNGEHIRDRLGRWSHFRFDALRRPVSITDRGGRTVTFQWCACGSLDALIDAIGNRTRWERDDQGRVTKEIRTNGAEIEYTYQDASGRLETVTDPSDIVATFEYLIDGRLDQKTYSDTTPDVTFTYDYLGRVSSVANGTDTLSWTYDRNGRVLSESSTKNSSTVSYTYDEVGNRRTTTLNGTPFHTYDYDKTLRLESITRGSNVFSFDYDVASRRTSLVYPNGIATTYAYDNESRLQRVTAKLGTTVVTDFQYTYNAVGNRTQKQIPDLTENYEYDRADQLVEVVRTGTAANRWYYAYDPAGNRTTEQIGNSPVQANYDNMNRLSSTSAGGALAFKGNLNEPATVTVQGKLALVDGSNKFEGPVSTSSGTNTVAVVATDPMGNARTNTYEVNVSGSGKTFAYDANGNLTQTIDGADTWTYEWNAENQLKKVLKNAATIATFAYDPLGRRVEKVAGGTTTTFTYDVEDILRESAGATTTYYVHGPSIDEPLAKEISGSSTYYHADALGSVLKMTNTAGSVTHEYRYDAYGRIEAGSTQGGYSFTGREWDPETSLFYYRARYYDPEAGRFLKEDPIGFEAGINLYAYVSNDPLNRRDPFGLMDFFLGYEIDLVGLIGVEFGHGIVVDTDDLGSSGIFRNYGSAGGANAGYSWGGGLCIRDIEGWALGVDANVKKGSVAVTLDDKGLNGFAVGVGPGVGGSVSSTFTETLTVRDVWNWLFN